MKNAIAITLLAAMMLAIVSCATTNVPPDRYNTQKGAAVGAAVGALFGQAIGRDTEGTLLGAGIGTLLGSIIGNAVDQSHQAATEDRPGCAFAAPGAGVHLVRV